MSDVMQAELRAFSDRVLMMLHREAMTCRDVEDISRFLRIFYHTMVDQMSEEQRDAAAGKRAYTPEDALAWESKFKELLAVFEATKQAIEKMERAGFEVEGRADFRQAELDLRGMLSVPVERLQQAAESVHQRRGRSLAEVRDALRRRLHA